VPTDRTIFNQKLDLTIRGNEKGTCMLIDVENSGNVTLIRREVQKILNIKPRSRHAAGVERKKKAVPVITGATGTISKSLRQ
jgi:hypothetical protein